MIQVCVALTESVNTPSLEPRGRLLISKLLFPKCDFKGNEMAVSARYSHFENQCVGVEVPAKTKTRTVDYGSDIELIIRAIEEQEVLIHQQYGFTFSSK